MGGVTYLGSPSTSIGASALGIISPDGKCYSFDAAANGYMRSEGVFVVAIKPLSAAEHDGETDLRHHRRDRPKHGGHG